jgi:biopolymer transport protein ExbB
LEETTQPAAGLVDAENGAQPSGALEAVPEAEFGAGLLEPALLDRARDFLAAGGPVVWILLACSVVALAIVLIKLWQFQAARLGDRARSREAISLLRQGRDDEALDRVAHCVNPVARVLAQAIRGRRRRDLPEAVVREEVMRSGAEILEKLRSHLTALEVIGGVAPLLGLFGTVLGMIEAFRKLAEAGNQVNPAILSGGIWEALLTTAVGLAVAIPVVVLCNWFERRVERVAHEMESLVTQVFTQDLSQDFAVARDETRDSAGLRLASAE